MSISSLDFISPKITLYYNGHNSHVSSLGGFLSLCLLFITLVIIFYCFWDLIDPKYCTSFIYDEDTIESKISQKINYFGINHFIQIYSYNNNGYFDDFDNKNIIIYGIKENKQIYNNNNDDILNLELINIEHWRYDKCEKILGFHENMFSQISNIVNNYTSSICLRYYFNPKDKKYYEIGNEGYIEPSLETNNLKEKKYPYKIIIKKCIDSPFINNYMGFKCNSENEINNYLGKYKEIFIYFSNNKIVPFNFKNPFKKTYYSISTSLKNFSFFENNIIFIPTKVKIKKGFFVQTHKDYMSYTLDFYYNIEKIKNLDYKNIVGLFNLYLNNKIINHEIITMNLIDIISHLGGIIKILFFIFEVLNYLNHHYTIIENTKKLFRITSGIDTEFYNEKDDLNFDNMRHLTTKNYKIRQLNTNDELNRNFSPIINKGKLKLPEFSPKAKPKSRLSSKKNNFPIYPVKMIINKKNNINLFKRNTNTFFIRNHDKRKSYLSQGFHIKNKDYKDNTSSFINGQSINEYKSYNENQSLDNNSNYFKSKENKENNLKSKKSMNKYNISIREKKTRKSNLNLPNNKYINEKSDRNQHLFLKNSNNERHKSIISSNQKNRNSIFNKKSFFRKISSELKNDSSQQMLSNNKNLLITINHNKTQKERNKVEEKFNGVELTKNNNIEMVNGENNLNIISYNNGGNIDPSSILKTLVKSKLKLEINEPKDDFNQSLLNKKTDFYEFFKSLFVCRRKNMNKIGLINIFRLKLLSEEHLYRNHINLYLIQKIFQIDDSYKFDINELYYNL